MAYDYRNNRIFLIAYDTIVNWGHTLFISNDNGRTFTEKGTEQGSSIWQIDTNPEGKLRSIHPGTDILRLERFDQNGENIEMIDGPANIVTQNVLYISARNCNSDNVDICPNKNLFWYLKKTDCFLNHTRIV